MLKYFSCQVIQPTISFSRLPETICFKRPEAETLYSFDIYSAKEKDSKTLIEDQKAHRPLLHKTKINIYLHVY